MGLFASVKPRRPSGAEPPDFGALSAERAMTGDFCGRIVARLLRFVVVVPLTAFTLHALQRSISWWSWCGVCALSLLFVWCIDGCVAFSRWRRRRSPD